MNNTHYANREYFVNGRSGFKLTEALRLWKTKYRGDFNEFTKEVVFHPALNDFKMFVQEMWESITEVSVEEALQVGNVEHRRVYFDCIGVERLFKELDPELKDRQVIKKVRKRWDDDNGSFDYRFEDVYELYRIDRKKLFHTGTDARVTMEDVYAVRCWCTTTNREYWIYVPATVANQTVYTPNEKGTGFKHQTVNDAISCIAWTIRINVENPERIYRQGDIIVAKMGKDSKELSFPRHLTKEEYLQLMYSET